MDTIVSTIEENEDIGNTVLFRYTNSTQEDHQHLCAVVGAMSQELKDQKLPLTPITYFGATISSLDRLSTDPNPADSVITALLTFLSMVLPQISVPVLRKRRAFVMDPVLRVIRFEDMSVGAVNAGLKCVSHVLVVSEKVNWLDISKEYNVLLVFVTDSRSKVRKQSHSCLRDILQSFQRSAVLAPASEGITSIFERFLLLAGGSSSTDSGPRKGAQEVLHILDALKNCLSLMSMNAVTSILKYFKSLLELRQPLVTRRIANSLQLLCLSPTSEVASDILLDLLCKLAKSASEDEKSVDSLTFTARLLDVGIRKVYSLNRESSVKKLPFIFYALGEILACEHEEAAFAAMEALRGLISSCIDGGLIKEEVEQMSDDEAPTTIVKICANIEKLLDDRFSAVWDLSLKVVSVMFDKLGEFSFKLLRGTVMSLANMQDLTDEALQYRKQLHECFGSALGAMGPKRFLVLLPLNLEAKDPSKANVWLFPILKQYTVGASLSFFGKSILGKVGELRQKSQMLEQEGQIYSSRSADALIYPLWSLLPAFCNYPLDTASSFKDLKKGLCDALRDEPDVRGIICLSLQILIQQNKSLLEEKNDMLNDDISIAVQRAKATYTPQVAAENLNALKLAAHEFLSVLSGVFMKSTTDSGGCVQGLPSDGVIERADSYKHMSVIVELKSVELLVDLMRFPGQLILCSTRAIFMSHIAAARESDSAENDSCDSPLEPNSPLYGYADRADAECLEQDEAIQPLHQQRLEASSNVAGPSLRNVMLRPTTSLDRNLSLSHSEPNIANTFWRRSRRKVIAEQRTASSRKSIFESWVQDPLHVRPITRASSFLA